MQLLLNLWKLTRRCMCPGPSRFSVEEEEGWIRRIRRIVGENASEPLFPLKLWIRLPASAKAQTTIDEAHNMSLPFPEQYSPMNRLVK